MTREGPRVMPAPALAALALLVVLVLLALSQGSAAVDFEARPTAIPKNDEGTQRDVVIAAGPEDLLYAVWEDGRYVPSSRGTILMFSWSDVDARGRIWNAEDTISPADQMNDMTSPDMTVGPDGVVHVVWQELNRGEATAGGPFWEVRYAFSEDGGDSWDVIRVSQPNNRNNTRPSVVATSSAIAYVAWEMEDHPGTSLVLAKVQRGSRVWIRTDLADASADWELNSHVDLGIDAGGTVHMAWQALDMDGMWNVRRSQVLYRTAPAVDRDSLLSEPLEVSDGEANRTVGGPSMAVTKRNGVWVAWVQTPDATVTDQRVGIVTDHIIEGEAGTDVHVALLRPAPAAEPDVRAAPGLDDGAMLVISGVGSVPYPPMFTHTCSEQKCFGEPAPVVANGVSVSTQASLTRDSLGNVYVAWSDGQNVMCTQRRNSAPAVPELLRPDVATNDPKPEFAWSFSDPDAGAAQGAFEIWYSQDPTFPQDATLGGLVMGVPGKNARYTTTETLEEGRWHWKVRTRDELGLWSAFSAVGTFLADRTPPVGTVDINGGDEYTSARVVVLTLNATDNLEELGGDRYFMISTDPDFPNALKHEWPPPNHQVNQELPAGEGIKVVFFRIFDASGLFHTSMDTIIYNETLVVIIHDPEATAPYNKPLNISCEVMRGKGVTASLFFRTTGDKDYTEKEMESNGTQFWYVIPKDKLSLKGLDYYIRVRSSSGVVTSPAESPADEPHQVEVYETTDVYQPPIYNPLVTFTGALVVLVAMFMIWYYRMRD